MKRLWIALGILAVLLSAALCCGAALRGSLSDVAQELRLAHEAVQAGDWAQAQTVTARAFRLWERSSGSLHFLLRHGDIDAISLGFQEVTQLLNHRERGDYAAANARLIAQLGLLWQAEQLTLQNLF